MEMLTIEQLVPQDQLVCKLDVAEDWRHHYEIKELYGKRKETVERVFAGGAYCRCANSEETCQLDMDPTCKGKRKYIWNVL